MTSTMIEITHRMQSNSLIEEINYNNAESLIKSIARCHFCYILPQNFKMDQISFQPPGGPYTKRISTPGCTSRQIRMQVCNSRPTQLYVIL